MTYIYIYDIYIYIYIYNRAKEQGGAARFETVIQTLKSDLAESTQTMVGHAKSSTGATDGGLLKLVYIAEQMQVVQGIHISNTLATH
jgi:hypothetical protein